MHLSDDVTKAMIIGQWENRRNYDGPRADLNALGMVVTSRWLDDSAFTQEDVLNGLYDDQGIKAEHSVKASGAAKMDLEDLLSANMTILFSPDPRQPIWRGAHMFEFGVAYAQKRFYQAFAGVDLMRVVAIGYRTHNYMWLDDIEFYATWDEFLSTLKQEKLDAAVQILHVPNSNRLVLP